jgi:hypothetical protein
MTKKQRDRKERLMPGGKPRYIRCYDDADGDSADRYTIVFTGRYRHWVGGQFIYLAMSAYPLSAGGFCQHGSSHTQIDVNKWGFAPMVGRKNHLGRRVRWEELPIGCRMFIASDYRKLWSL